MRSLAVERAAWLLLALAVLFSGCEAVLGIDDLVADRKPDGGCSEQCGEPGCGVCPASPQIAVPLSDGGEYRIDAYEVTNAEYRAWLLTAPNGGSQRVECAWNHSFVPGESSLGELDAGHVCIGWLESESALAHDQYPVACVDWCDAIAYCKWAGRRLCGALDGTSILSTPSSSPHLSPEISQWHRACTENGVRTYPYGDSFELGACSHDGTSAKPVGQHKSCEGGYAEIYDLSGNVSEWEDACMQYNIEPMQQNCFTRGGEWWHTFDAGVTDAPVLACSSAGERMRATQSNGIGFRCCEVGP